MLLLSMKTGFEVFEWNC